MASSLLSSVLTFFYISHTNTHSIACNQHQLIIEEKINPNLSTGSAFAEAKFILKKSDKTVVSLPTEYFLKDLPYLKGISVITAEEGVEDKALRALFFDPQQISTTEFVEISTCLKQKKLELENVLKDKLQIFIPLYLVHAKYESLKYTFNGPDQSNYLVFLPSGKLSVIDKNGTNHLYLDKNYRLSNFALKMSEQFFKGLEIKTKNFKNNEGKNFLEALNIDFATLTKP